MSIHRLLLWENKGNGVGKEIGGTEMKQEDLKKVVCYIVLSAFIFSTMEVALKLGGGAFDPLQITLIRFVIGGLVLLPLALSDLKKRGERITRGDILYMAGLGLLCICVSMLFFQMGVMNANASTVAVVFSINPMFTMLFAHFLTEEKMNRRKVGALAVSLVGILIMMNPLHMAQGNTVKGMILTLLSALTFGLYSAVGKFRIKRLGGMTQTSVSFILGSIGLAAVVLLTGRPILDGITLSVLPNILYVGVIVTGFGYVFYFKAIELGGAAKGSMVFFLKPIIAPVVALLMLHEGITITTVAGVAVLLIGSYINMTDTSAADAEKTQGEEMGIDGYAHEDNRAG